MTGSLTVLAPAKLNLALAVGAPVADRLGVVGMHPICSWMVTVDLFDELLLTRLSSGRLSRYAILWHEDAKRRSDIDWSIAKDLAVQAHQAMEEHIGRSLPVQLKMEKRIPVGGGLGGGSSDAAAMLRGLNDLFQLGLSPDELAEIGIEIGSDVAFLVRGGSAIVEGFGECIERHDSPPDLHAALVFPEVSCPTGEVYALFDEFSPRNHVLRSREVRELVSARDMTDLEELMFNDLMMAALQVAPSLLEQLDQVAELAERPARISGSGSSIFVLCDDEVHAQALASAVEERLELPAVAVSTVEAGVHA